MTTSNIFFNEECTAVSFLLNDGSISAEFKYIDIALYFLDTYFKENNITLEVAGKIFEYLFEEGSLEAVNEGYLAPLFLLYLLGYPIELGKDHLPYGLVLFQKKHKEYHFCGINKKKERIPLSPKFYFKHELQTFLDFLHTGGAIDDIKLFHFIDHMESIDMYEEEFGGKVFPKNWNLGTFIPYRFSS